MRTYIVVVRRHRLAALVMTAALAVGAETLLLADVLDTRALCARAGDWVASHRDSLPRLYDDVVSFPMAYRRAIFANLPPDVRAALWREQLDRMQTEKSLNDDQTAFVEWAKREVLVPATYEKPVTREFLEDLATRVRAVFPASDPELRHYLSRLGPADAAMSKITRQSLEGQRIRVALAIQDGLEAVHATGGTCMCNIEGQDLYPWECYSGTMHCGTPQPDGCASWQACGIFGTANCDGCCLNWSGGGFCN